MRLSVLDLAFVPAGADAAEALHNTMDLARHAEAWGYRRFWLAEHHNMVGIASAATAVLIGQVAAVTGTIRVGAGGIMLPNHPPLVVAEQFGTLEALYPGRIDLGLGRAPGTDGVTARALRRGPVTDDSFPREVEQLQTLFGPAQPGQPVQAVPGAGLQVPIWILGSSLFGARLAARMGLPYAFASHFAPEALMQALELYRSEFTPSAQLDRPHTMAGVNVFAAATDAEGRRLLSSAQQQFAGLFRGAPGKLPAPVEDMEQLWRSPAERDYASAALECSFVGAPETVRDDLRQFIKDTAVDEVIVSSAIHDHSARLRSYEILAGLSLD